jgi:hypothetical protein
MTIQGMVTVALRIAVSPRTVAALPQHVQQPEFCGDHRSGRQDQLFRARLAVLMVPEWQTAGQPELLTPDADAAHNSAHVARASRSRTTGWEVQGPGAFPPLGFTGETRETPVPLVPWGATGAFRQAARQPSTFVKWLCHNHFVSIRADWWMPFPPPLQRYPIKPFPPADVVQWQLAYYPTAPLSIKHGWFALGPAWIRPDALLASPVGI